jgi:biofilm PGA synthesis lipoprotein PgaB
VFLHALSQAAGGIGEPYFPNRQGTMRADLFNRVAWQLATRCDVKVFAVVPAALGLAPPGPAAALVEDLARAAAIDGLYFPPAASGLDAGDGAFALALAARRWRAPLAVARGITQEQATPQVLAALGGGTQMIVLTQLRGELPAVPRRMADPGAGAPETARVVLLLDGRERPGERRAGEALAERMRAFKRAGLIDFGYREDDFLHDNPPLAQIAPALAVRETTFK